jgi:nitroreductase
MMNRVSVRKFYKKPVDDKLIGVMLHMAVQSPSAGNVQEWRFIVVKNDELKKKLYEAALRQDFIKDAPVVIVVCADLKSISLKYGKRGELLYALQDTANATMSMLLAAHALGLGSVWVGAFDEDKVKFILDLPEHIRPVAILPIGYPAEKPKKPDRIPFENVTWVDKWGEKYEISYHTQPGPKRELKPFGEIFEKTLKEKIKKLPKEEKSILAKLFKQP